MYFIGASMFSTVAGACTLDSLGGIGSSKGKAAGGWVFSFTRPAPPTVARRSEPPPRSYREAELMSDSTSKVRSTKLTFKGDKKGKKRKRKDKDVGGDDSGGEGSDAEGADPQ
ncbi:hypothetical protein FRC00_007662, partial [Tulasnella sp. 408]